MAAIESEIDFGVQVYGLFSFKKVEICLHTKFRWVVSLQDWDKPTSGFRKWMAAILEFYFQFRFWPMRSHRHAILHLPAVPNLQ